MGRLTKAHDGFQAHSLYVSLLTIAHEKMESDST